MNPEGLKKIWQAQTSQRRLTIDTAQLLNEVQRNQRRFASLIFWRDVREVSVALLLVPLWIYLGREMHRPWTWYLAIPVLLSIAGFHLADRMRQKRRQPMPGDTLRECIESSLAQIEHQIWLLRNVFWWNVLPMGAAVTIYFAHRAWLARNHGLVALFHWGREAGVLALIFWGVYWLNQFAVRKYLEPRRQEMEALLESLKSNSE